LAFRLNKVHFFYFFLEFTCILSFYLLECEGIHYLDSAKGVRIDEQ